MQLHDDLTPKSCSPHQYLRHGQIHGLKVKWLRDMHLKAVGQGVMVLVVVNVEMIGFRPCADGDAEVRCGPSASCESLVRIY